MANVSSSNGIEKRPKLRFPEFKSEWEHTQLGLSGEFYGGLSGKNKEDFGHGDAKFITYRNVFSNTFASDELLESVEVNQNERQNRVQKGDVLFTQSSETFEEVGMSSVWLHESKPFLNSFCMGWHPNSQKFNPIFMGYLLRTPTIRKQIICQGQGISRINLAASRIANIDLYHPSSDEQVKIANLLSLLEQRIEITCKIIENLKKYKRGLLDKLLEDNSSDANWHIVRLQDVANGFDYGMNSAATTFDGVHKYIRITDIDDDSRQYLSDDIVSPSDTPEEKYRVYDNDILFARTGASVGKSYLYTPEDGELYFAGFLIRISVKKEYNSYFVYLNTLTSKYEKWLRLESMRSGQPGVNAEQYRNYAFRCPDYQTQVKIASIIKGIDLRISKERMSLSKLNSLKNGLLQQLFI